MLETTKTESGVVKTYQHICLPDTTYNIKVQVRKERTVIWINDVEVVINLATSDDIIYITKGFT